jgi:hypothetical protein
MVHCQEQRVLIVTKSQQRSPQEGSLGEIERALGFLSGQSTDFGFSPGLRQAT